MIHRKSMRHLAVLAALAFVLAWSSSRDGPVAGQRLVGLPGPRRPRAFNKLYSGRAGYSGLSQGYGYESGPRDAVRPPLQQMWSYANTGDYAPTYYLQTDAPLYYYSFTDAFMAMAYKSLPREQQERLDPMITGFNPSDMYAVDHIRRVLTTFPGVFSGIGEFTIHKEFVSGKIPGETASLKNPALDRVFDFAGEVGLPVILHNDADVPFPKPNQEPYQILQLRDLFLRHPKTTIIWAHIGLGRIVRPAKDQIGIVERASTIPVSAICTSISLGRSGEVSCRYAGDGRSSGGSHQPVSRTVSCLERTKSVLPTRQNI